MPLGTVLGPGSDPDERVALLLGTEGDGLSARWQHEGLKPFHVRVGIHSDAVLVGNIGTPERFAYTLLGDEVNLASRLRRAFTSSDSGPSEARRCCMP